MKHQRKLLGKLVVLLLVLSVQGGFVQFVRAATVGDANDYIIQVDNDDEGTGTFSVQDFHGDSTTITTISSTAQSTVISATTNDGTGGTSTVTNSLTVDGTTTTNSGALTVTGATTLSSTLGVTGATTLTGALTANGGETVNNGSTIYSGSSTGNQMIVDGTSSRFVSADGTQSVAVSNSGTTITGAAGHTLSVTSSTTTVNGTATINSGNGSGNQMVVDATSSRFVSADTYSNATVADDSVSLLADSDGSSANARSALSMAPTSASLLVNTDSGVSHGITIGQTSTVISGGTTSTDLTLDDTGATFSDGSGGSVKVTGIADGVGDYDAVNMRQYRKLEDRVDKAYSGIASVAALAGIPAPVPGKNVSLGIGYGNFRSENAIAVGGKALVGKNKNITVTGGVGICRDITTVSGGIGWSF